MREIPEQVLIIGAGPYGLSLAAHFTTAGIPFEIIGEPMESWRRNMPDGMILKSEAYASSLADPNGAYTLERFRKIKGLPYNPVGRPLPLAEFLEYAEWFAGSAVNGIIDDKVQSLRRVAGGFEARLSRGIKQARHVVVATGVVPYRYVPPALSDMLGSRLSHSIDHHDLRAFNGKDVVVVGCGQSGLETAALLREAGARPRLIARTPTLRWHVPPQVPRSRMSHLLRPDAGIAIGWPAWICAEQPWLFRHLPLSYRQHLVATKLGPSGAWWLRPRVVDKVPVSCVQEVLGATARMGRIHLSVRNSEGVDEISADHMIAATGFRVDIERLTFIDRDLLAQIDRRSGSPVLSSRFESSVEGLFFVGAPAAQSFGSVMRFMYGAKIPARALAQSLVRLARRRVPLREAAT